MEDLSRWIGRNEVLHDSLGPTPVVALGATLDHPAAEASTGAPLPPLWHWLYFLPHQRQSEIGPDGHAKRGGFLPPVPLPRRMWAGGRLQWLQPIRLGDEVRRESRIESVTHKTGRAGDLVFVQVHHHVHTAQGLALTEEHDIVYRAPPPPPPARAPSAAPGGVPPTVDLRAPRAAVWQRLIVPSDVLLFRYSALTFNGHRIHYDRRYVTTQEGYPGLVVHGPLMATMLLDLLRRHLPQALVQYFEFKAVSPVFDTTPFWICGQPEANGKLIKLWVQIAGGPVAMEASATLL